LQRDGPELIDPPLRLLTDQDEADLPQHPQVLGDAGLALL
jgi:hypothetical protein